MKVSSSTGTSSACGICSAAARSAIQTGNDTGKGEPYFGITAEEAFITKVSSKGAEDGSVTQDVDMVFKTIAIAYKPQKLAGGGLDVAKDFTWDIGKMKTDGPGKMDLNVK